MSRLFTLLSIILIAGLVLTLLSACAREDISPVEATVNAKAQLHDPEQATLENAAAVVEALQAWSEAEQYELPATLGDVNSWGKTMQSYLPENGKLLVNPFTGKYSEPRTQDTGEPGIIYFGVPEHTPRPHYSVLVKAYGADGVIYSDWVRGRGLPIRIRRTRMNALILRVAVEDWARRNNGLYPWRLTDFNQNHRSVYDLLPDGRMMVNAYNNLRVEPSDTPCDCVGSVWYDKYRKNDGTIRYAIIAQGLANQWVGEWFSSNTPPPIIPPYQYVNPHITDPEIATLNDALAVRRAVEEWSHENGGGFPAKLHSSNALGHTVFDLLAGGVRIRNPFTGAATEPREGAPTAAGQIGYHGIAGVPPDSSYRLEAYWDDRVFWSYDSFRAADAVEARSAAIDTE